MQSAHTRVIKRLDKMCRSQKFFDGLRGFCVSVRSRENVERQVFR